MKILLKQENKSVLKFEKGEEVMETIKKFCESEKIQAGFFVGLGASSYLKLASYNLETKKYEETEFNETLEIANLTGNVAMMDGKMIIHCHGTFSNKELQGIAGHVMSCIIGGACEVMFNKFDGTLIRKYDPATGLNLLD